MSVSEKDIQIPESEKQYMLATKNMKVEELRESLLNIKVLVFAQEKNKLIIRANNLADNFDLGAETH